MEVREQGGLVGAERHGEGVRLPAHGGLAGADARDLEAVFGEGLGEGWCAEAQGEEGGEEKLRGEEKQDREEKSAGE